mgnify:FL=1
MIIRFGGHSKAAGVTIKKERFKEFHHHFLELLVKTSCEIEPKTVITDGELNASEITLGNAQLVKYAAPWGQDFPEPVFDNQFEVIDIKEMSGKHLRFMLRMAGYEVTIPAVWFNADQNMTPTVGTTTRLVYSLDINSFNGKQRLQLLIKDII